MADAAGRERKRQVKTRQSASTAMAVLILETPSSRSTKVIGTSAIRSPDSAARQVVSTWKE